VRAGQRGRRAARGRGGRGAEGAGGGWRGGAHVGCGLKAGAPGDEVLEAVELAVVSRLHEGREAVLRRRGGGATRGERAGGGEGGAAAGRRAARAVGEVAEGAAGGSRGGAHLICGLEVHPLRHEALEGGEVALPCRLDKILLRLRAQPSALSAVAGSKGWARRV
jgi:hypothetical protein